MSKFDPSIVSSARGGHLGAGDAAFTRGMRALINTSGWLKFIGVLAIIYGILVALSIVGLIIAWLPIWFGALLHRAGNRFFVAQQANEMELASEGIEALASAIKILAITMLVAILLYIVGFTIAMVRGVAMIVP